jgi:hypothetical protein
MLIYGKRPSQVVTVAEQALRVLGIESEQNDSRGQRLLQRNTGPPAHSGEIENGDW